MLPFTKMHGIGNDYLYVDAVTDPRLADRSDWPQLSRAMSDRRTGAGSDGLIIIAPPTAASRISPRTGVRMIMFNADGSRGEMCGNGIRCVCKFAVDHGLVDRSAKPVLVETDSGVLNLDYVLDCAGKVASVTVDMGMPRLAPAEIPVNPERLAASPLQPVDSRALIRRIDLSAVASSSLSPPPVSTSAGTPRPRLPVPVHLDAVFVSMGNPHAVVFCDVDLDSFPLETVGPVIEHHPAFPKRINFHIARVLSRNEIRMRTWERGSGITMACGTGASAVCVAGALRGLTDRTDILIHLPGGDLSLRWDDRTDHVFKTGPAVEVFRGHWPESSDA